ncbi:hypothetical protein CAP39_09545 [Sphingomonas sp. IBVSS1]|uniref:DUF192 domain-containing protein n=1 Tax=Sandarakinorhabdus cyanobacteriorum TaxID=1981098 RepID=A0A255YUY8_9SPHN|nr:DUF192 domain-containing protein [Sandarakinorhabdus cyanobacteriorum]OSZ69033.1 hypothetical protein CAP39_09545 [Sphingomonas sp. IBVSS1]OYQ33047.1 hypothetical protein CHU93_03360 [Sandarakinorhabdus cyanobacteriorum]
MIASRLLLCLATAATLASLTPAGAATPCPNTGLATRKVSFTTAKGRFTYQVEVARTAEQQACGMMFRETMAPGTGMSFPMTPPRQTGFWMENTILPLDIIYVSPAKRVLNVRRGQPYSRDVLMSAGVTADVIELAAGEADRIGLKPGDRVN